MNIDKLLVIGVINIKKYIKALIESIGCNLKCCKFKDEYNNKEFPKQ